MPHVVLLNVFARSAVFWMRCSVCTFAGILPSNNFVLCFWSALPDAGALHEASSRGSRKRSGDGWWGHAFFYIDDATRGTACQHFMPHGTGSGPRGQAGRSFVGAWACSGLLFPHSVQAGRPVSGACMNRMPLVYCAILIFGKNTACLFCSALS